MENLIKFNELNAQRIKLINSGEHNPSVIKSIERNLNKLQKLINKEANELYSKNIAHANSILTNKQTVAPVRTLPNNDFASTGARFKLIADNPFKWVGNELKPVNYGTNLVDTLNELYYPVNQFNESELEFLLTPSNF